MLLVACSTVVLVVFVLVVRSAVARGTDTWGFPLVTGTELTLVSQSCGSRVGCNPDSRILFFKDRTGRSVPDLEDALWPAMLEAGWVRAGPDDGDWLNNDGTIRATVHVERMVADQAPGAGEVSAVNAMLVRVGSCFACDDP